MAPEKKNEFLDAADSEDDGDVGYESEDDDMRKGGRSAKRRRIDDNSEDDVASDLDHDANDDEDDNQETSAEAPAKEKDDSDKAKSKDSKHKAKDAGLLDLPDITRPLTKKNLVASEAAIKKSGVVYLSRIPPFMKPQKLRSLLEPYGTINRIFLTPEDPAWRARRVRGGGNKKKSYTEGWVEFVKKKDAKAVCEMLNARTIGGKKGSYYRDDLWNLLYLNGFKWHNLTEQIATENAERTSRMRAEITKTTKENKDFVKNVERAKMLDGMQAKAKKRKADDGTAEGKVRQGGSRTFQQVPLAKKKVEVEDQPADVSRVLSKIF
ncbi:Pre-rRNA-processing protein ESF2 [Neonectria ditissima]|uniref:18S rRNA factor 2 n=1 Tax=Neonectria ditissima TaxID=78410 RepID=A0A0P7B9E5_9HYPO|nr:Pre-rRNA-processing protein ESF2 [Neonectria ditissima]